MSILSTRPNLDRANPQVRVCDHPEGQPCRCDGSHFLVDAPDDYALALAVANRRALGLPVDAASLARARAAYGVTVAAKPLTDAEWWALQNKTFDATDQTPIEVLDETSPFDWDAVATLFDVDRAGPTVEDAEFPWLSAFAGHGYGPDLDTLAGERQAEEGRWS